MKKYYLSSIPSVSRGTNLMYMIHRRDKDMDRLISKHRNKDIALKKLKKLNGR